MGRFADQMDEAGDALVWTRRRSSRGDGLCIAVAERLGLPLAGGDKYWSRVPLQVEFLPFR